MFGMDGRFGHWVIVVSGSPGTFECVACSARRQRTVSPITNTEYAGWRLSPSLTRDPVTVERKA